MTSVEILEKLISFNVFGGEANLSIIDWIDSYINSFGIETRRVYNKDKTKANIHCRIGPEVDGGFILSGHTDVVPVEGQKWTSDPFVLTDKNDGKLYGRGACDMKGFVACCLAMLPEFTKADLKKPIYFAFSYDEEIGCLGAPSMVADFNNYYSENPQYAIIGEPSDMVPVIGQKGICVMETIVNGSAGHSSRIKQEVSAIHEASRLIIWLEEKMDSLVKAGHIDDRFTPSHTSIQIGKINGGVATNIIADKCTFDWDIRIIPRDSVDEILIEFSDYCRNREVILQKIFPDFRIKTNMHNPEVPPLNTSADSDILSIVQKLTKRSDWSAVSYAAEAGQFSEGGFETIICGPGSIEQAHRADEFVEKEQLELAIEMLKSLKDYLEK